MFSLISEIHAPVSKSAASLTFLMHMSIELDEDAVGGGCWGNQEAGVPPSSSSFTFRHRGKLLERWTARGEGRAVGMRVKGRGVCGQDLKEMMSVVVDQGLDHQRR